MFDMDSNQIMFFMELCLFVCLFVSSLKSTTNYLTTHILSTKTIDYTNRHSNFFLLICCVCIIDQISIVETSHLLILAQQNDQIDSGFVSLHEYKQAIVDEQDNFGAENEKDEKFHR